MVEPRMWVDIDDWTDDFDDELRYQRFMHRYNARLIS
jgi:hypothetical protein